jgi:hypothetical protein
MAQLPVNLIADRPRSIGGGQTGSLGGVPGSTERVRAHMRDRRRLPGRPGSSRRSGSLRVTSCAVSDKPAANFSGDTEFATSKGPGPGDGITRAAVSGYFGLEQCEHPLCTVGRPHRDDTPVRLAQRLRRTHTPHLLSCFTTWALDAARTKLAARCTVMLARAEERVFFRRVA